MVSRDKVLEILHTLEEYIDELKSYHSLPRERVVGERQLQSAVRYALQAAIQCVLDAGAHVLVDEGLARLRDNKSVLQELGRHGVLPRSFAERIERMAGLRNILVHRYFQVDPERIYEHSATESMISTSSLDT